MCWNKPFKALATAMYDQWLVEEGISQETPSGFGVTRNQSCALNLPTDGSKDEEIHCLKENQPFKKGKEILASQLRTEKDENPFTDAAEIDEEDVNEATTNVLNIDSDNEER